MTPPMLPFITIGIASYNYARFLPRAFEAIKRQKFKDFEILYCDDGSTDNSVEVIKGFIRDNPDMHIRLIEGENNGVVANKKRIQDNAYGTYVMLCDADDWMSDNCLEILANAAIHSNANRIIGEVALVDKDGKEIRCLDIANPSSKWMHTLWHGCLYRTEIFRKYDFGEPRGFYSDDYYFIQTYNLHCGDTEFVRNTVYFNCVHGGNATTITSLNGSWKPEENFTQIIDFTVNLSKSISDKDVLQTLEYQVIKFYYQALMAGARGSSDRISFYTYAHRLHEKITQSYPEYRKSKRVCLFKGNYDRSYGKWGVWIMVQLEKTGLLLPILFARK